MKRMTFYLFVILGIISCDFNDRDLARKRFFTKLESFKKSNLPGLYDNILIFIKCKANKISYTTVSAINYKYDEIYKTKYREKYVDFLMLITEEKIKIDCSDFEQSYFMDYMIKNEFEKFGFEFIKKKYFKSVGNNIYTPIDFIKYDKLMTILYFAYKNHYYCELSDMPPIYIIRSIY